MALLFNFAAYGQKPVKVFINHFYTVIDSADLAALQTADYVKNQLCGIQTRTTQAENGQSWTGTYIFGVDNYFEIFDQNGLKFAPDLFGTGIALGVEDVGQIKIVGDRVQAKFKTERITRSAQIADKLIPWFESLSISDRDTSQKSDLSLWVMEYRTEFYEYRQLDYQHNRLSSTEYLKKFEKERAGKILKRFTGFSIRVSSADRFFLTTLFGELGYQKISKNTYQLPDNFRIKLLKQTANNRSGLACVDFENSTPHNATIQISPKVQIKLRGDKGSIFFD